MYPRPRGADPYGLLRELYETPTYLTTPSPGIAPDMELPYVPRKKPEYKFTLLSPITDGVGNFHANHFIGYFKATERFKAAPPSAVAAMLSNAFFQKFSTFFNPGNVTKVTMTGARFQGSPTVKFSMNKPLADTHEDWVSMHKAGAGNSFYGKTLERGWTEVQEVVVLSAASPPPINLVTVQANRRHVLAGRRSWMIGYSPESKLFYVETPAFERYSHLLYLGLSDTLGMREIIRKSWITLLENFAMSMGFKFESWPPNTYGYCRTGSNVFFTEAEDKSYETLFKAPWLPGVFKRHPGLFTTQ